MKLYRRDLPIFREFTDEQLAELLNLSPRYIRDVRQRRSREIPEKLRLRACQKLHRSESDLFGTPQEVK